MTRRRKRNHVSHRSQHAGGIAMNTPDGEMPAAGNQENTRHRAPTPDPSGHWHRPVTGESSTRRATGSHRGTTFYNSSAKGRCTLKGQRLHEQSQQRFETVVEYLHRQHLRRQAHSIVITRQQRADREQEVQRQHCEEQPPGQRSMRAAAPRPSLSNPRRAVGGVAPWGGAFGHASLDMPLTFLCQ